MGIAPLLTGAGGRPFGIAEAVVFVHGNPGSSRDWQTLAAAVAEFGRAVALDMPGFGRADKPREFDYTVPGYARHLAGALTELGIRRAHLVLHDFGGPWGLSWEAGHPQEFASATLWRAVGALGGKAGGRGTARETKDEHQPSGMSPNTAFGTRSNERSIMSSCEESSGRASWTTIYDDSLQIQPPDGRRTASPRRASSGPRCKV